MSVRCEFVGYRQGDPSLYDGINYNALAQELYDATLGQLGTDEGKVFDVFVKAVGRPLLKLMARDVEIVKYSEFRKGGILGGGYNYTEHERAIKKWADVWPVCSKVGEYNKNEASFVAIVATYQLSIALREKAKYSPAGLLEDAMSLEDFHFLSDFGTVVREFGFHPSYATYDRCMKGLLWDEGVVRVIPPEEIMMAGVLCARIDPEGAAAMDDNAVDELEKAKAENLWWLDDIVTFN